MYVRTLLLTALAFPLLTGCPDRQNEAPERPPLTETPPADPTDPDELNVMGTPDSGAAPAVVPPANPTDPDELNVMGRPGDDED